MLSHCCMEGQKCLEKQVVTIFHCHPNILHSIPAHGDRLQVQTEARWGRVRQGSRHGRRRTQKWSPHVLHEHEEGGVNEWNARQLENLLTDVKYQTYLVNKFWLIFNRLFLRFSISIFLGYCILAGFGLEIIRFGADKQRCVLIVLVSWVVCTKLKIIINYFSIYLGTPYRHTDCDARGWRFRQSSPVVFYYSGNPAI